MSSMCCHLLLIFNKLHTAKKEARFQRASWTGYPRLVDPQRLLYMLSISERIHDDANVTQKKHEQWSRAIVIVTKC